MHPTMNEKRIFHAKHAPQANFHGKNALQARLIKQNAPQAGIFSSVLMQWVPCPIDMVCNLFTTNHSSKTSSFNESIDLGPA